MFSLKKVMVVVANLVVVVVKTCVQCSMKWDDQRELEVVKVLLEEKTLMSSSRHRLMVRWRMLVIWVCDQWRIKKWLWWMEFLRVRLGNLVIRLALEMKALVDAMKVYSG
uniref:Transmembrane protein n=1 Tax=Tanacetum cinerariifolium TaxID=118510 RepID=A0A699KHA0_TANCI|nr:hypothetical protein [Tanacetum cinerariifolium]